MNRTIWKYPLPFLDTATEFIDVEMPVDGKVLCMQLQNNTPTIWVDVSHPQTTPMVNRRFRIFGTGNPILVENGKRLIYVGTFQTYGGTFVFHIYEEVENFGGSHA